MTKTIAADSYHRERRPKLEMPQDTNLHKEAGIARPLLLVLMLLAAFGCILMAILTTSDSNTRQHLTFTSPTQHLLYKQPQQHVHSSPAPLTLAQRKELVCGPSALTIVIPAYIDHMPQLKNYFESVLDNVIDSGELRWHVMLSNNDERLYAQQLLQPLQYRNVSVSATQQQQQQQRLNITYSDIWTTLEDDGALKAAKITNPNELEER